MLRRVTIWLGTDRSPKEAALDLTELVNAAGYRVQHLRNQPWDGRPEWLPPKSQHKKKNETKLA
jgi:hypothetical protein